jgi:hypothetical protein
MSRSRSPSQGERLQMIRQAVFVAIGAELAAEELLEAQAQAER